MCKAIRDLMDDSWEKGIEAGREKGYEEGREKTLIEAAKNLLDVLHHILIKNN